MEEKGTVKISLAGFFLILAIIAIVIIGFFMYQFYIDKQKANEKVETLDSEVTRLQGTINSIQSTINNTNDSNSSSTPTTSDNNQKINLTDNTLVALAKATLDMDNDLSGFPIFRLRIVTTNEYINQLAGTADPDTFIKTNIKYEDFKNELLKYYTEEYFNKSISQWYKNMDGYLGTTTAAGGIVPTSISKVELISRNKDSYTFKVTYRDDEMYEHYLSQDGIKESDCYSIHKVIFKYVNDYLVIDEFISEN